jgi:hypothetical protein
VPQRGACVHPRLRGGPLLRRVARGPGVRLGRARDRPRGADGPGRRRRGDRAAAPPPGRGLLRGGTAYFSIFSGDASLPHFCLSGLAGELDLEALAAHLGPSDAIASVLAHSVGAVRAALRLAGEAGAAALDGLSWSLARGRATHEPRFFVHRLLVGALLREVSVQNILLDVSRGVPVVFCDLLGFDEYAHRRGPDSRLAMRNLAAADAALAVVLSAADAAPELGYDVYVLSDHGHVRTRPFEVLTGVPLVEYVARADRGAPLPRGAPEARPRPRGGARAVGTSRTDGIAVAEAGDLAHVYFLHDQGPLPLAAIEARHRRVLAALTSSPAVGILGVRGGRRGLALVRGVPLDLADAADVARLPHPEPAVAAAYVSDLLTLPEAGDVVVFGWRGPEQPTVAYAWEFGSHGGLDPEEIGSFVLHPPGVAFPFREVVRPAELHAFFEVRHRAPLEAASPLGAPG